jgi:hypothetical protein
LASKSACSTKLFPGKQLRLAKRLANCSPIGEMLGERVGFWHQAIRRQPVAARQVSRQSLANWRAGWRAGQVSGTKLFTGKRLLLANWLEAQA